MKFVVRLLSPSLSLSLISLRISSSSRSLASLLLFSAPQQKNEEDGSIRTKEKKKKKKKMDSFEPRRISDDCCCYCSSSAPSFTPRSFSPFLFQSWNEKQLRPLAWITRARERTSFSHSAFLRYIYLSQHT